LNREPMISPAIAPSMLDGPRDYTKVNSDGTQPEARQIGL
jgi:hypothetical protein